MSKNVLLDFILLVVPFFSDHSIDVNTFDKTFDTFFAEWLTDKKC